MEEDFLNCNVQMLSRYFSDRLLEEVLTKPSEDTKREEGLGTKEEDLPKKEVKEFPRGVAKWKSQNSLQSGLGRLRTPKGMSLRK